MMPENREAWAIWQEVKTQWRASGMGIIGLVYSEVRQAATELGIEYSPGMRRKIKVLERVSLEIANSADK